MDNNPVNPFGESPQPAPAPDNNQNQNQPVTPVAPVANSAPVAPVPIVGSAPITSVVSPSGQNGAPKKSHLGLILGLSIGGGVLIIGAIITVLLLVFGGSSIKNLDDLRAAILNKDAINCVMSDENNTVTIQTTKGWDKFYTSDGTQNVLAIKGDAMYMWNSQKAQKTDYDGSVLDDFVSVVRNGDDEDNAKITVKCSSPSRANFTVPNKKWNSTDDLDDYYDDVEDFDDLDNEDDTDTTDTTNTTNSGSTAKSEISINATINASKVGVTYKATKLVMNAFAISQDVKDAHYWTNQVPVMVYVTASRAADSGVASVGVYTVKFVDGDGNSLMDYGGSSDVKSLAKAAGYTVNHDYTSAEKGESVSDWVILMVKPDMSKDNIYMVYDQPAYKVIGGSGGTIPAETFKVQLTK